ncbi:MAG: zinc metalloprotease HtpX, partial [Thermoleophilia bacterium]|nr:zinc metalloprotease HtpX [Thermoleophilia bacterium]
MYEQISANKRKSTLLMSGFLLIYAAIAYALYLWV